MLTHRTLDCATEGCYAVITVHPNEERRLRRTHETFYCPAGHSNYFAGKTDEEKRIEELERREANLERWLEGAYEQSEGLRDALTAVAHSMQVCPLGCGWKTSRRLVGYPPSEEQIGRYFDRVGQDLVEHLVGEHNARTRRPVALLDAGPSSGGS